MTTNLFLERKMAIMQLRKGQAIEEVAQNMNRSVGWVSKWKKRFETEGWPGLRDRSRAPKRPGKTLPVEVKSAICQARMELECEAALGNGLKYIGGRAIRTRLKQSKVTPLPSVPTIERVIREAGLTKPKVNDNAGIITYPRLHPTQPHQLIQVDIVPHFLSGGQRIACFNSIDVVSRYPTGRAYAQRRSDDAANFLIHTWQEVGISRYTQVDNEGCFSGGATHPYVLGKVVRLALHVGTELLFSPCYHPQSNGTIERFHQDYNYHVWQDTYLSDLAAVNQQGEHFFRLYRQRSDHSQLKGQTPDQRHQYQSRQRLSSEFRLSTTKIPLREGRLHFMRRVAPDRTVRVLNVVWDVPDHDTTKGVWVTIDFGTRASTLSVFDAAPDAQQRRQLAVYPFPLKESVLPRTDIIDTSSAKPDQQLLSSVVSHTKRLTRKLIFTML
jgi:transposase InsO family protein